jgi:ketosteroid isomerase-like protein
MRRTVRRVVICLSLLLTGTLALAEPEETDLSSQVEAVERAFAQTMADRDHRAFTSYLSEETVFLSGPIAMRGKEAVAASWRRFFEGPEAPFSWEPGTIEVLESGALALSTGPVRNAAGELVATYTSVWRQEEPGVWRIVFDKDNRVCPEPEPSS